MTKNMESQNASLFSIYYEMAYATLKQCSIQKQLERPLMKITYGATLQTPQK